MSKMRRDIMKSIPSISSGFNDPKTWISTGNYALNYLISSDFNKGIPLGKSVMFAGESGCLPASAKVTIYVNEHEEETTVGQLREVHGITKVEIKTPDGFIEIGQWFDKGVLEMVLVRLENGMSTRCAVNHMIETKDGVTIGDESDLLWTAAVDLVSDQEVNTVNGWTRVISVEKIDSEECYDFEVLHANHRYYGDGISSHNSGKSFIVSGSIVKHAQQMGVFPIVIDSENALDEAWLQALGVDTSPDKMERVAASMIDDVALYISNFIKEYRKSYGDVDPDSRPKILFVVDSLGMLMTPTDVDQFEKGNMKGDMGRKPRALKALVTNITNMFGDLDIGLVTTNHTYASQDMFDPSDKISGGSGVVFAASIVVAMQKRKLKEDANGNKIADTTGIRSAMEVRKSRYAKPFEKLEIKIPYDQGLSPYAGLVDLMESRGLLRKDGNRLAYDDENGEVVKMYKKAYERNENNVLDTLMVLYEQRKNALEDGIDFIDDELETSEEI